MIKCVSQKYYPMSNKKPLYIKQLIMDSEADFSKLPEAAPGSYAVIADGSKKYMVNASGNWVEYAGTGGYPFCEEVEF